MQHSEEVTYLEGLISKVFKSLGKPKLFKNTDFQIVGKEYENHVILTTNNNDLIRLDIILYNEGMEFHLDKTSETFSYGLEYIQENEASIVKIITMIFTSKIKVEYCGEKYTKLSFFAKEETPIYTHVYKKGLFTFKRKCIEKIYFPIYSY